MSFCIDLNADIGEGCSTDAELLPLVTSASIACGFHAGNPATMLATLAAAKRAGVAVGAHPGFEDRENFGRREITVSDDEVFALVAYQVGAFAALARAHDVHPQHVKPHGALYNMAARDRTLAGSIVRAIAATDPTLIVFALSGSELACVAESHGLCVAHEVFADRHYLADGSLVPRSRPDALLNDPVEAAERVVRMVSDGLIRAIDGAELRLRADTVCVHGDTPDAFEFARQIRSHLASAGVNFRSPSKG